MGRILNLNKLLLQMIERNKYRNFFESAILSVFVFGLFGLSLIPFAYVYSILR